MLCPDSDSRKGLFCVFPKAIGSVAGFGLAKAEPDSAKKVAPHCLQLTGVDISPKTIERASINLSAYPNIVYLCADFLRYPFSFTYDVIYSSLTMMHFEDKQGVIAKVDSLLKDGGVFCLSIDKNQSKLIYMGDRRIEVYPDTVDDIVSSLSKTNMKLSAVREIENAFLITCNK